MRNLLFDADINDKTIFSFLRFNLLGIRCAISELPKIEYDMFSHLILSEYTDKNFNLGSIKQILNKDRMKFHIVSVHPKSAKIAAFAARDRRIDAIYLDHKATLKIFNMKFARRLEENNKLVILDLSIFFNHLKASTIRSLYRVIEVMGRSKVPFILTISSGIRDYRALQAVAKLLGLESKQTDDNSLRQRIQLNAKKIAGKFPFEGVEVIG